MSHESQVVYAVPTHLREREPFAFGRTVGEVAKLVAIGFVAAQILSSDALPALSALTGGDPVLCDRRGVGACPDSAPTTGRLAWTCFPVWGDAATARLALRAAWTWPSSNEVRRIGQARLVRARAGSCAVDTACERWCRGRSLLAALSQGWSLDMRALASVQDTSLDVVWIHDRVVCLGHRLSDRCYRGALAVEGPPEAFAQEIERVQPMLDGFAGFLNAFGQPSIGAPSAIQILVRAEPGDLSEYATRLEARAARLPPELAQSSAGGCSLGASDRSCSRSVTSPRVRGGSGGVTAGRGPCRQAGHRRVSSWALVSRRARTGRIGSSRNTSIASASIWASGSRGPACWRGAWMTPR